jgi:DNA-binding transcriptional LysR family regulator
LAQPYRSAIDCFPPDAGCSGNRVPESHCDTMGGLLNAGAAVGAVGRGGQPCPPKSGSTTLLRALRGTKAVSLARSVPFEKRGQAVLIDAPGSLTLDEPGLMLEAALAGAGLAYIGEPSAAEHIAAGRLEVVLGDWTPPYPGLSLYFAGRRHIPARLRAMIELIREQKHTIGRLQATTSM